MQEWVRSIGMAQTPEDVLAQATAAGRRLAGVDTALGAVSRDDGVYEMVTVEGNDDPGLLDIRITEGVGLGGRVLEEGHPVTLADYGAEPSITGHWKGVVGEAGLHGTACVGARLPGGPGVLLYAAQQDVGAPGDRTTELMVQVAEVSAVTLHGLAEQRRRIDLEVLQERQRLAAQLHDSVAQMLFAIGVCAERGQHERSPEAVVEALAEIERTAAGARAELRDVFARLTEPLPGLALEALVEAGGRLAERLGACRVVTTRDGAARPVTDLVQALVADTVREGLRNAHKHAGAAVAVVHLAYTPAEVGITVQHEVGRTAGEQRWTAFAEGSGLGILAARARALGGELELRTDGDGSLALGLRVPAP